MHADFYTLYNDYSTIELLKIQHQVNEYEPEAINAATRLLSERYVSAEEIQLADQYFRNIEHNKNALNEFAGPALQPAGNMPPGKWLKFVLLVIAVDYAADVYRAVAYFINLALHNKGHVFNQTDLVCLFLFIYPPFLFFLLYKRKQLAWILLFGQNIIGSVAICCSLYQCMSIYNEMVPEHPILWHTIFKTSLFIQMLIQLGIACFVYTTPVSAYLNVSKKTKLITAAVALGISLVIIGFYI